MGFLVCLHFISICHCIAHMMKTNDVAKSPGAQVLGAYALLSVLGRIQIPLPGAAAAATGHTLGCCMLGMVLPLSRGLLAAVAFALTNAVGAPKAKWGFIAGFPVCTVLMSAWKGESPSQFRLVAVAAAAQSVVVSMGASWLVVGNGLSLKQAMRSGVYP